MTKIAIKTTLTFLIFAPLVSFVLLVIKGLPHFAIDHPIDVLVWVYQATSLPALVSGGLLAAVLAGVQPRIGFFTEPYDFGRCFSLGAIAGALAEAFSTAAYRALTHHPFSGFLIAEAMIAGAITGAVIVPILFHGLEGNLRLR